MHRLYGTFLIHLVEQTLREAGVFLSAKEISLKIKELPSAREQRNFEYRIRRAITLLEEEDLLLKEQHRISRNLVCFKYKINQDAKRPEFS